MFEFYENGVGRAVYSSYGHNLHFICACTVRLNVILKVKNAFLKPVYSYGMLFIVNEKTVSFK
jgi:hypothetical protein